MQPGECANQQGHSFFDAQPAAEHEMRILRRLPFEGMSRTSNGYSERLGCDAVRLKLALHVVTACEHKVWLTNGAFNANIPNPLADPMRQGKTAGLAADRAGL